MSFDPYHEWLGISPEEQPVDCYRLLGVRQFEANASVIDNSAERQLLMLKTRQNGPHSALAQKLMNEVSSSRIRLLDARKKGKYDSELRQRIDTARPTADPPRAMGPPVVQNRRKPEPLPTKKPVRFPLLHSAHWKARSPITGLDDHGLFDAARIKRSVWIALRITATIGLVAVSLWLFGTLKSSTTADRQVSRDPRNKPSVQPPVPTLPILGSAHHNKTDMAASDGSLRTSPESKPISESHIGLSSRENEGPGKSRDKPKPPRPSALPRANLGSKPDKMTSDSLPKEAVLAGGNAAPTRELNGDRTVDDGDSETDDVGGPNAPLARGSENDQPDVARTLPLESQVSSNPGGNLPIPPDSANQQSRDLIKEVCGEEYANAKTDKQKRALAEMLLGKAAESQDSANRYVLFCEARDVATDCGDVQTAFQAIDEMRLSFRVDSVKMKVRVLSAISKKARLPSDRVSIVEHAFGLVNQAIAHNDFDLADNLIEMALAQARKTRNRELVKWIVASKKEFAKIAAAHAEVKSAAEKLKENPTDPAANLVVGRFHCTLKGDWENGLPMLALGSDPALSHLAVKELGNVLEATEQYVMGDAWWDLAQKEKGLVRANILAHAASWYELALPNRNGLEKTKIEKRLAEARRPVPGFRFMADKTTRVGNELTVSLNDFSQWKINMGEWTSEGGKFVGAGDCGLRFAQELPADFTLEFKMNVISGMRPRVMLKGFRFGTEGYIKTVFIYGTETKGTPMTYENGQQMQVRLRIQRGDVELFIDEKAVATAKIKPEDAQSLSLQGGDGWSPGSTAFYDFKLTATAKAVE